MCSVMIKKKAYTMMVNNSKKYSQTKQPPLVSSYETQKDNIYGVENLGHGLGQEHRCGGFI